MFLIARLRTVMFCAAMPCSSGSARRFGKQSWDYWYLAWFTIRSWRWRRKISPKYWAASDLHGVTSRRYVIEVHQTGFRPNASPTDKIFLMRVQWVSARSGVEAGPSRAESRYCLECWDVFLIVILKIEGNKHKLRRLTYLPTSLGLKLLYVRAFGELFVLRFWVYSYH